MGIFKKIVEVWGSISLIKRIVIGLAVGIALALAWPNIAAIELLGTLFRTALASCAPILVFFIVISALANAKTTGGMKTVVILYVISMLLAAIVSIAASYLFPIELTLAEATTDQAAPQDVGEVLNSVILSAVANPVEALTNGNYLGILAWAVLIGIALRSASETSKDVFNAISEAVTTAGDNERALALLTALGFPSTSPRRSSCACSPPSAPAAPRAWRADHCCSSRWPARCSASPTRWRCRSSPSASSSAWCRIPARRRSTRPPTCCSPRRPTTVRV